MSLESRARVSLAVLPTPIAEAHRLRAALGGPARCPRILIKRDDLTGLALGGNEARKLEFLMADAGSMPTWWSRAAPRNPTTRE